MSDTKQFYSFSQPNFFKTIANHGEKIFYLLIFLGILFTYQDLKGQFLIDVTLLVSVLFLILIVVGKFVSKIVWRLDIDFAEKIIHKYPELTFPGPVQASIFESCEYDICKDNVKIISFCIRYGLIPDVYESMIAKEYDDDDYDDEDDYLRRLNEENPVLKKLNYLEMMARLYICPKILRYIRNNRSYIRFALWYTVPTLLMVDKFRGQLLLSCIKDIVSYV